MKKISKLISKRSIPFIFLGISLLVFAYSIVLVLRAPSKGERMGQSYGTIVGKAIGSFEGFTKGRREGTEDGKKEGLNAEDTEAEIANEIKKIENLEVLVASVKINDMHTIGEDQKYAALYMIKGEVVFSVDLQSAKVKLQNDQLHIVLQPPTGKLYIDQSQTEKIAEYQKYYFSGSAEDGFDAYINTMNMLQKTTAEELGNYSVLLDAAKESAKKQVSQLATSANTKKRKVVVEFEEGRSNDR